MAYRASCYKQKYLNDKVAEAPAVPFILWLYTDGTKLGQTALEEGTIRISLVCKPRERNLVVFKLDVH